MLKLLEFHDWGDQADHARQSVSFLVPIPCLSSSIFLEKKAWVENVSQGQADSYVPWSNETLEMYVNLSLSGIALSQRSCSSWLHPTSWGAADIKGYSRLQKPVPALPH